MNITKIENKTISFSFLIKKSKKSIKILNRGIKTKIQRPSLVISTLLKTHPIVKTNPVKITPQRLKFVLKSKKSICLILTLLNFNIFMIEFPLRSSERPL